MVRSLLLILIFLLTLSLFSGCVNIDYISFYPHDGDSDSDYDMEYDFEFTRVNGVPPKPRKVGASCQGLSDCDTNSCMTSLMLQHFLGWEVEVPNGYCSNLDRFSDSCSEDVCNEDNGGLCVNGGFMGEDYLLVVFCLRPCQINADCRVEDDHICLDPEQWVAEGKISPEERDWYFNGQMVCMPLEFANKMEQEIGTD